MKYLLSAFILLCSMQSACAKSILSKDGKELTVQLDEVVITGTGTEHYLKMPPRTDRGHYQQSAGTIPGPQHGRPAGRPLPFANLQ